MFQRFFCHTTVLLLQILHWKLAKDVIYGKFRVTQIDPSEHVQLDVDNGGLAWILQITVTNPDGSSIP